MDFVLVSLLTASFLIDWCYAEITTPQDNENCYSACPAGYRSSRKCDDEKYTCKICQKGTFTEIYNTHGSCLTCTACNSDKHGIELQPCVHNRNTLCGCEKGYYNMGRPEELMCTKCFSVLSKKCKNCKK
ncbi:tumor necrosis factor receptor superfamily member 1A-like [Thalassophryne amazonica]|uniref:tumor necrosis factor receptor superfamily member 1A-like n=1 Tax=Thalassophryne amazonica TaxID=390379 RepID=UPI001471B728|nr:tumor necrosis factor receptor superfamily member 1A-like [Thalassophryne amazonica]